MNYESLCALPGCEKKAVNVYCSSACVGKHERVLRAEAWLSGGWRETQKVPESVRKYLIASVGAKCTKCGWSEVHPITGRVPLEVNHIDGDSRNNSPANLEVICPNCHSLTDSYRGLNRGKGRKSRVAKSEDQLRTKMLRAETRLKKERLVLAAGIDIERIHQYSICDCGKLKNKGAQKCRACMTRYMPPSKVELYFGGLESVLSSVSRIGFEASGRQAGVTGNTIRKYVSKYGVNTKTIGRFARS